MALNFIATLEAVLGVSDLPFERWLAEHSESADALTVGSLVDWLRDLPEVADLAAVTRGSEASAKSSEPR
jgi:hypothetical protein